MIKVTLEFENEAELVSYFKGYHPGVAAAIKSTEDAEEKSANEFRRKFRAESNAREAAALAAFEEKVNRADQVKEPKAPKPVKAEAPVAPTPTATATATATPPAAPVPSAPVVESPSEIDYAQVSAAITKLALTDKPKVVAALAKFGAKRGPELKAEQYADFLAALA